VFCFPQAAKQAYRMAYIVGYKAMMEGLIDPTARSRSQLFERCVTAAN